MFKLNFNDSGANLKEINSPSVGRKVNNLLLCLVAIAIASASAIVTALALFSTFARLRSATASFC